MKTAEPSPESSKQTPSPGQLLNEHILGDIPLRHDSRRDGDDDVLGITIRGKVVTREDN